MRCEPACWLLGLPSLGRRGGESVVYLRFQILLLILTVMGLGNNVN